MAGPYSPFSPGNASRECFRIGESPLWASWVFSGQPVKAVSFPFKEKDKATHQAREIHAVSWEIYTENKQDLINLMWLGELSWDFPQANIAIGPVSMFHGSFYDLFFSQGHMSDLEELAKVKGEEEWRAMCQTFLIGKTHFFRGLCRYEKTPVLLPAGAVWDVKLSFPDEPFTPKGDTRMRIILNGRWRTVVEVG